MILFRIWTYLSGNEIKNSISKNDDVLLKLPRFKIEYVKTIWVV